MATLTQDECNIIGHKFFGQNAMVDGFDLVPIKDEVMKGHLGDYFKLHLKTKDGKRGIFFVKRMLDQPNNPEFVKRAVSKEVAFYNKLEKASSRLEDLDASFSPICYYTSMNFIVLECLETEYENVSSLEKKHLEAALTQLAKMHTFSIVSSFLLHDTMGDDIVEEAMFVRYKSQAGMDYVSGINQGICKAIEELTPKKLSKEDFKVRFLELADAAALSFNTVDMENVNVCCHGDLWANNIMFKMHDNKVEDCKLIDFQLTRFAPPAHDIATIMIHNQDAAIIKNNLENYIQQYYDNLKDELIVHRIDIKSILTFEKFLSTFKHHIILAKYTKLYYKAFEGANKKRKQNMIKKPLNHIMQESDKRFILDVMNSDSTYKEQFLRDFEEMENLLSCIDVPQEMCYLLLNNKLGTLDYAYIQHSLINNKLEVQISQQHATKSHHFIVIKYDSAHHDQFTKNFTFNKVLVLNHQSFAPRCFLGTCRDMLIFEDITQDGYQHITSRKPLGLDEVKTVIQSMAELHAIGYSQIKGRTTVMNKESSLISSKRFGGLISNIQYLETQTSKAENRLFEKFVMESLNNLQNLLRPSVIYFNTLCHGNLSFKNIYLKYDDSKPLQCKLTNFENFVLRPPSDDLLSLLFFHTTTSFRQFFFEQIQQFYYEQLHAAMSEKNCDLKAVMTFEDFKTSCDKSLLPVLLQSAIYHEHSLIDEKAEIEAEGVDHKTWGQIKTDSLVNDPVYRERQLEAIDALKKYFVNSSGALQE